MRKYKETRKRNQIFPEINPLIQPTEQPVRSPDKVIRECLLGNGDPPYPLHFPYVPQLPPPSYFFSYPRQLYEEEEEENKSIQEEKYRNIKIYPEREIETTELYYNDDQIQDTDQYTDQTQYKNQYHYEEDTELEWIYQQMINASIEESQRENTERQEEETQEETKERYDTPSPKPLRPPNPFPISRIPTTQELQFTPISSEPLPENPAVHSLNVKIKRLHSIENSKERKEIYETILTVISIYTEDPTAIQSHIPIYTETKEKIHYLLKSIRLTKEEMQLCKEIFEYII